MKTRKILCVVAGVLSALFAMACGILGSKASSQELLTGAFVYMFILAALGFFAAASGKHHHDQEDR